MEVKLKEIGDVTIVSLVGKLDIEKSGPFKRACMKSLAGKKVVFSFEGLQFVGSTGIQSFFHLFNELQQATTASVKLAHVQPDFMRVFQYSALQQLEVHEDVNRAIASFQAVGDSPL